MSGFHCPRPSCESLRLRTLSRTANILLCREDVSIGGGPATCIQSVRDSRKLIEPVDSNLDGRALLRTEHSSAAAVAGDAGASPGDTAAAAARYATQDGDVQATGLMPSTSRSAQLYTAGRRADGLAGHGQRSHEYIPGASRTASIHNSTRMIL